MSSVNEVNAYERGKREGYDIGHTAGSTEMLETAKREGTSLRWWKLVIAVVLGFLIGTEVASAQATAQTSVTVTISAEVPCTVENAEHSVTCLQEDEPVEIQSVQPEGNWWSKMVKWWKEFIT